MVEPKPQTEQPLIVLSNIVGQAVDRYRTQETFMFETHDGRKLVHSYDSLIAAEDTLNDFLRETGLSIRNVIFPVIDQTNIDASDIKIMFDGGVEFDNYDDIFHSLAREIVYLEMLRLDPSIRKEDDRRSKIMSRERSWSRT